MKEPKLEGKITYVEDWYGKGEYYIFSTKWTNEDEWGLDTAFKLLDYGEEKAGVISYQALTKIREWQRMGIPFHFGK